MKKFVTAAVLAAMLGTVSYSAFAQESQTPPPPPPAVAEQQPDAGQPGDMAEYGKRHKHGRHGHDRMGGKGGKGRMMIDANGDNVIGDSEAAALADHGFMRLDRDDSGDLDEAEFTTVRGKRGGWWNWSQAQDEGVTEGLKAKFATLDADKNGKVSKAEFMADAQTRFAAADTNKDGKVSPWEFYAQN